MNRPAVRWLKWLSRTVIVGIFLVLLGLAYAAYEGLLPGIGTPATPTPATTRNRTALSAGLVKVFFTTPALIYPDRRNQRDVSPLLKAVLADVDAATERIDVAVFDFDLEPLAEALIAADKRGVTVRMVIDSVNLEAPEVSAITGELKQAGIPITFDDRDAFMHNKFIVIDQRITWLGSWNMTNNDTYRNNNNMLRLRSVLTAEAFSQEFDQLFGGIFGPAKTAYAHPQVRLDQTPVNIYFAPEDQPAQYLLAELARAKRSIRFMAFSFTSDAIAEALIEREQAGVDVQGVMESQNIAGVGAVFEQLRRARVRVLEDGNCYIMHHKVFIIDDRLVFTGSYNFTNNAERNNDEHLVLISDREIAALYNDEFERVYSQAENPTRCN